jgi:hypothetical protein
MALAYSFQSVSTGRRYRLSPLGNFEYVLEINGVATGDTGSRSAAQSHAIQDANSLNAEFDELERMRNLSAWSEAMVALDRRE